MEPLEEGVVSPLLYPFQVKDHMKPIEEGEFITFQINTLPKSHNKGSYEEWVLASSLINSFHLNHHMGLLMELSYATNLIDPFLNSLFRKG
jgi:hypothetical protein